MTEAHQNGAAFLGLAFVWWMLRRLHRAMQANRELLRLNQQHLEQSPDR